MAVNIQELLGEVSDGDALEKIARALKLTEMQKNYVHEFVKNGGQRVKAAIAAGYSPEDRAYAEDKSDKSQRAVKARATFNVQAYTLMKNPKIVTAIQEYAKVYVSQRKTAIENDVFRVAQIRATYDIRKLADSFTGYSPEDIAEKIKNLTEEESLCIDNVEFRYYGSQAQKFSAKITFADKDKSLALLSKLSGMLVDKKEITNIGDKAPQINIQVVNQ